MGNMVVVGSGPAGVSAAIYAARAGVSVTVLSKGVGALLKAERIDNYYGLEAPLTGVELHRAGIRQAEQLGVSFETCEVVGIEFGEKLTLRTAQGEYAADCVVLSTGSSRAAPKIPGLAQFEGKGVSYCATCDAFFYRGKDVAVLGYSQYALFEALELEAVAKSVTMLTNGNAPDVEIPERIFVNALPIAQIQGVDRVAGVSFADDTRISVDGVFVAYGTAGSADLARKIGALTQGNKILVDENMQTNVPGLFAAGDCTGGMLQIAKAVYEGAKAGSEAAKLIRKKERG